MHPGGTSQRAMSPVRKEYDHDMTSSTRVSTSGSGVQHHYWWTHEHGNYPSDMLAPSAEPQIQTDA